MPTQQILNWKHVLSFIVVYLVLCYFSVAFKIDSKQVIIFWPASGLAIVFFMRYGLFWSIPLALSLLLLHVFIYPVPVLFIVFSILSNVIGFSLAALYFRNQKPTSFLSTSNIFALLRSSALMATTGGIIGAFGMAVSGIASYSDFWLNAIIWCLSNLLGIFCISPLLFLLTAPASKNPAHLIYDHYASRNEKIIWCIALSASYPFIFFSSLNKTSYTLVLTILPIALLIWSAIRFQPIWTFTGQTLTVLIISTLTGLGFAGFTQPNSANDMILLLLFLCLISLFPIILQSSSHENRWATRNTIRRATTDLETGLPNRIAFEDDLRLVLNSFGAPQTLAYLDFDHFNVINDTASHKAGDELIKGIASMLTSILYSSDKIFRIGGDEFALLLSCDGPEAKLRAQRIISSIESFKLGWESNILSITASIGLVAVKPGFSDFAQLLSQADAACFTAKELGGNRICVAVKNSDELEDRTQAMHSAVLIRTALEQNYFELCCQDILSLTSKSTSGLNFEVLLRLRHPHTGELMSPKSFIPAAERFHLGVKIDMHVINLLLDWMERHTEHAAIVETCSINLSASSMQDENFLEFLKERLKSSSFPANKIVFEITESYAMHDLARAQALIKHIRLIGCRFALDDFGTGFCSFNYLQNLDADIIKIDGSFVRNLHTSELSRAIIRSITEIAHILNKTTTAEHCESLEIIELLRELGVDYAQGFGIHKPEAIADYFSLNA
jgi:diguanylate cyclase (GGDEF)-like protein